MESNPIDPTAVDFELDPSTGDLKLTRGEATAVRGLDAIAQLCRLCLGLWRRKWFWSPAEGLPMLDKVMARGVPLEDIKAIFNRALLAVPGVKSVVSLTVERQNEPRKLKVDFVVNTNAGVLNSADYLPFIVTA